MNSKDFLKDQSKTTHGHASGDIDTIKEENDEFSCNKCGEKFSNENDIVDHLIATSHNLSGEDRQILFG